MRSSRYMNGGGTAAASAAPVWSPFALPGLIGGGSGISGSAGNLKLTTGRAEAARARGFTHVRFEKVGPSRLPDFYMPFRAGRNPHLEAARRNLVDWSHRVGILEEGVWDEPALLDYDLPLCSAGLDPDATPDELDLSAAWLAWGTYADDYYPAVFGPTRDLPAARLTNERLAEFMPLDAATFPLTP